MALSEFGSLTREFYIAEIGTWENYGGKRVWRFIGGRYNEVLLYIHTMFLGCDCKHGCFSLLHILFFSLECTLKGNYYALQNSYTHYIW